MLGGRRLRLDGARAYAEKNWGPGFAGRWWWGQANAFPDPDLGVAFAGGRLPLLGASAAPTAVVLRQGERVLRLAPPLARARHAWASSAGACGCAPRATGSSSRARPPGRSRTGCRCPTSRSGGWTCAPGSCSRAASGCASIADGARVIDAVSPLAGLELGEPPASAASSSARRTAAVSASAPTSLSKGPTTAHSARRRSAAVRSTGCTRASETSSARPSGQRRRPVGEDDAHRAALVPVPESPAPASAG